MTPCTVGAVKMKWDEDSRRVQEKMTEYAFSVSQKFNRKIGFINFLTQVTKDCDCMIYADLGTFAAVCALIFIHLGYWNIDSFTASDNRLQ